MHIHGYYFFVSTFFLIENKVFIEISLQERDNKDPIIGSYPY